MEIQWSLVLFTIISGAGSWLFATSMAQALLRKGDLPTKLECVVSAVLLGVGGVASVTHLQHIERIFEALNRPTSGIFVEAAMIGVLIVLIVVYFVMVVRKSNPIAIKVVGAVTMVVGAVFPFACGNSYMMEARQAWMTYALPLSYCFTTAVTGAGLNVLLKAVQKGDVEARIKRVGFAGVLQLVLSAVAAACCVAFFVHADAWAADAEAGYAAWTVATFISVAVGLLAGVVAWRKPSWGLAAGSVAVVAGVVCSVAMRCAMWLVGSPLMDVFMIAIG